jgi:hypothetical protein
MKVTAVKYTQASGFQDVEVAQTATEDDFDKDYVDAVLKAEGMEDECWGRGDYLGHVFGVGLKLFRPSRPECSWDGVFLVFIGEKAEFVFTSTPSDTMAFFCEHAVKMAFMPDEVESHMAGGDPRSKESSLLLGQGD